MNRLTIRSNLGDYDVDFRDDERWAAELGEVENAFFIVDRLVWRLHGSKSLAPLASHPLQLVEASEDAKTVEGVAALCDSLIERAAKRNAVIIAIGGGVVQDAAGFLASVIYRGIKWIYVPTTLLAQADSCIGAKTSLNFRQYKNLLGTMYPPRHVVIHPALVMTLSDDHFFSGLGEIVKMHLVAGPAATARLEPRMGALRHRELSAVGDAVRASLRIKQAFIEEDEFDRGSRRLLNFGHCFGHAIESASEFAVPHGQAVTLGIMLAGLVSCERGLLARSRLRELALRLLIPTLTAAASIDGLDRNAVVDAMRHDKKRSGSGLAVVLPLQDGSLTLAGDVTAAEASRALEELPVALAWDGGASAPGTR